MSDIIEPAPPPAPLHNSVCDRCGKPPQPGVYVLQCPDGAWVHDPDKNPCSLYGLDAAAVDSQLCGLATEIDGPHASARKRVAAKAATRLEACLDKDGCPTLDVLSAWYRYSVIAETGVDPGW